MGGGPDWRTNRRGQEKSLSLVDVVRFVIVTLQTWAKQRAWAELTISVSNGQIITVHEHKTHRDGLPGSDIRHKAEIRSIASGL